MPPARGSSLLGAAASAAVAALTLRALARSPLAGPMERTNHAGRTVSLGEGPAYVAGAAVVGLVAGPAPFVAVAGAGVFGAVDDFAGDSRSKGLKGHLGALAKGQVTTGAMKVVGIGATGLLAAWLADRDRQGRHVVTSLVGGGVIAASANLANLLDLRPGRALKATVLTAAPLLLSRDPRARSSAAVALGAAAGLLPGDLAGRTMLGDTGANAAGALVGTAFVQSRSLRARFVALTVLGALTLASERVSFTQVIESTPGLRELDALGRPRG